MILSKDVRLPVQLQRAMAAEAEAAREARAKVITAEGEHKASRALKEAAEVINESPIALQLRYLQTLTTIASEKNSTIVFPVNYFFTKFASFFCTLLLIDFFIIRFRLSFYTRCHLPTEICLENKFIIFRIFHWLILKFF